MIDTKATVLFSERLTLRPVNRGDEKYLWPHVTNEEICKYMAWDAHEKIEQTQNFIEHEIDRLNDSKGVTWVIFKDEVFCGIVSLIDLKTQHRGLVLNKAEFAYWTAPNEQRQGIMTEACQTVIKYAFDVLGLNKLVVSHFAIIVYTRDSRLNDLSQFN